MLHILKIDDKYEGGVSRQLACISIKNRKQIDWLHPPPHPTPIKKKKKLSQYIEYIDFMEFMVSFNNW